MRRLRVHRPITGITSDIKWLLIMYEDLLWFHLWSYSGISTRLTRHWVIDARVFGARNRLRTIPSVSRVYFLLSCFIEWHLFSICQDCTNSSWPSSTFFAISVKLWANHGNISYFILWMVGEYFINIIHDNAIIFMIFNHEKHLNRGTVNRSVRVEERGLIESGNKVMISNES